MKMKKTLIAAAVASVCAAPIAANAADVGGEVVAGIEYQNAEARTGNDNDDSELAAVLDTADVWLSGDEDLGNGLTANGLIVLDAAPGSGNNAAVDEVVLGLSGDFGSLSYRDGSDNAFYLHTVSMVDYGTVYDTYGAFFGGGARSVASDTLTDGIQYAYDGGAFQFAVDTQMQRQGTGSADAESFDTLGLGASFDAGPVTIGVGHETRNNAAAGAAEPSQTGVAVGGSAAGIDFGAAFVTFDRDDGSNSDSPSSIDLAAAMDFGGGMGGNVSLGMFDNDTSDDSGNQTRITAEINQSLSSRTMTFAQLRQVGTDGGSGGSDTDGTSIFVGMGHAF